MFGSGAPARLQLGLLVAVALVLSPTRARAQACCAAPSLTVPARLQRNESGGAGLQARGRGVYGAFAADGSFARTEGSDLETTEDLFAAARILGRAQVALVLPFVQTRRSVAGLSGSGGGLGDLRVGAHLELTRAGERRYVPGLALLAGLSLPTGTPPDAASDALAADATGTGTYEATIGVELEQRFERVFVSFAGSLSQRAPRAVRGVHEAFGPAVSVLASGGVVLDGELALGGFVVASGAGAARDLATDAVIAGSALGVVTAGLGVTLPLADGWRGRGTAAFDCPLAGLGRNQTTGAGLAVSVLRVWP